MDKSKLFSFNNYDVYLVINEDFTYYLSVPKQKGKYIMTINISKNAYILNNQVDNINNLIKNLYHDFDNTKSVLLIPSIDQNDYQNLANLDNKKTCNEVAKYISKTVNLAYKFLKDLDIEIDSNIKFMENELEFTDWFIGKYQDRIEKINLLDLLEKYKQEEKNNLRKVSASGINFIVGSNLTNEESFPNQLVEIKNPYDDFSQMYNEPDKPKRKDLAFSAGNISYYFIGTLVVITALLILALIIK